MAIAGQHLDRITKDQITTAANTADIDAAIKVLQDIAGITDGGIAGQCFSGFEWDSAQPDERFAQITYWLGIERIHYRAEALLEIERLSEAAKPITETEWGSERQIDAQNAFTQALEEHMSPAAWAKFEDSLYKADTYDIIRNGLEVARADLD